MGSANWHDALRSNEIYRVYTEALKEAGVEPEIRKSGAHPKIHFVFGGRRYALPISFSPSDRRSSLNARAQICRILLTPQIDAEAQQEMELENETGTDIVFPPILQQEVGAHLMQTTNARDLHSSLKVGRDFSTWIKARIEEYGFVENVDYIVDHAAPPIRGAGNRGARTEYHLTLDTAKEIAMVERNEAGRQVRRYFIGCEMMLKGGSQDADAAFDLISEQLNGLLTKVDAINSSGPLTETQMNEILKRLCEWENGRFKAVIEAVFASGGKVIKNLRGQPLIGGPSDEVDIDAAYKAMGLPDHLPARRKLSSLVGNRLDAYCRERRITIGLVISLGQRVRVWPRQAVLAWYGETGRDFIAAHIRRYSVDGQQVITFPTAGEAR